jgi:hypothetical protein
VPINILYCEGGKGSPDIRVISHLCPPGCLVEPIGSKYGLSDRVRLVRKLKQSSIAGLRDRDFDFNTDDFSPKLTPGEWCVNDNQTRVQIGWYWERKEIENYLIDPEVVTRALGKKAPRLDQYQAALQASAERIADYTAARIALSLSRLPRLLPLQNHWGEPQWKHYFPERFGESDCRTEIAKIVKQYEQNQIVKESDVLNKFEEILPSCRPGGSRFDHYLTFFSGKDLLSAMKTALEMFNLSSPPDFREQLIGKIERSTEDVWTWLPEWEKLRLLIQNTTLKEPS